MERAPYWREPSTLAWLAGLTGAAALSTLGGTGNVQVRSGQTTLHGGLGDDVIQVDFNNAAAQNLFGDGGHDRMVSGGGQSTLSGG